jgi:hypothetical protein
MLSSSNIVTLPNLFNHVVNTNLVTSHDPKDSQIDLQYNPNDYKIIMLGHTFSKLYAITLHLRLSKELE